MNLREYFLIVKRISSMVALNGGRLECAMYYIESENRYSLEEECSFYYYGSNVEKYEWINRANDIDYREYINPNSNKILRNYLGMRKESIFLYMIHLFSDMQFFNDYWIGR